jgi:endonuclease/exonuclease/phosphatase family metal-dependent hydrolase
VVTFNPYEPYGPVLGTTMRVVAWNVWGRYGEWEDRLAGIGQVLGEVRPDVVCLAESWSSAETTQVAVLADRLGLGHHVFAGDWEQDGWTSGVAVMSRWPIGASERRPLPDGTGRVAGEVLYSAVDGPRGRVQVFTVVLDFPLGASAARQAQVRCLTGFVTEVVEPRYPTVVCGDFNAGPDSDELRMLTGKSATASPGLVFYDSWEVAGDGTAGCTWSNANPLAAAALWPDRRIDYILSAWPRANGAGHPTHCEVVGARQGEVQLSDHYGVLADLRY